MSDEPIPARWADEETNPVGPPEVIDLVAAIGAADDAEAAGIEEAALDGGDVAPTWQIDPDDEGVDDGHG